MQYNYNAITTLAQERGLVLDPESFDTLSLLVLNGYRAGMPKEELGALIGDLMTQLTLMSADLGIDLREAYRQGYKRLANDLRKTTS